VTPVEFHGDLWHQKTRVHVLSCGVVYVILHLAVLVELRLVTDGLTDTEPWLVPRMHSTAREKNSNLPRQFCNQQHIHSHTSDTIRNTIT